MSLLFRKARTEEYDAPAWPRPGRRPSVNVYAKRPSKLSNRWLVWPAGLLAGAFVALFVLWATEPAPPPRAISVMTNSTVSDPASLMAAVQTAGLHGTPDVVGAIDELRRVDDGQVTLTGWVADKATGGAPLTVMVFTDGRNVLTAPTRGARADISRRFGLGERAAANIAFRGNVRCSRGHRLMVIAITPWNTYGHFGSRICP